MNKTTHKTKKQQKIHLVQKGMENLMQRKKELTKSQAKCI